MGGGYHIHSLCVSFFYEWVIYYNIIIIHYSYITNYGGDFETCHGKV